MYEAALRYYYSERYSTAGTATAAEIKAQAQSDYGRHLELIHGALSPYVLGERLSAVDAYLHMIASWYPGDATALSLRLPKLAQHAELLRRWPDLVREYQREIPELVTLQAWQETFAADGTVRR